jgi:hypothetical protein
MTERAVKQGLGLAVKAAEALEQDYRANGTRVVVMARAGQDLSKYKLRYSHLGYVFRTEDPQAGVRWEVVNKLNNCGTAAAAVYRQGLGDFFLDDLWRYEAAWVVPTKDVQQRLLVVLADNAKAIALNTPAYSVVSYAWGTKYQQSNQWALETLAEAMDPAITTRQRAQAWLQYKGYTPTTLNIGPLTRLGGRMTAANIAFDDHPNEKRFSDRIETVTVDSVFDWLRRSGMADAGPVRTLQMEP